MASVFPGAAAPEQRPHDPDSTAPSAAERHTFIGGSEAFELLNERQYGRGCARALAYRKSQVAKDFTPENHRRIALRGFLKRGQLLEDLAAKLYMEDTGRALIRRPRLVRNPDHPGAGVHTDRIILGHYENGDPEKHRPTGDAEIKTHGEGPFFNILRNGLPPGHNLQLQWSLFCTGHTWGSFIILGVFSGGADERTGLPLKHFDVERDPALMEIFARATDNFWSQLEHAELPPQLPDSADVRCKVCPWRLTCRGEMLDSAEYARLLQERSGKKPLQAVNSDELDQALADRALIRSEMEALDHEDEEDPGALQLVEARIKELVGDNEAVIVNRRWKVYCSETTWSGVDTHRLQQEHPEIYQKYYISKRPLGRKGLRIYPVDPERMR